MIVCAEHFSVSMLLLANFEICGFTGLHLLPII
jgi:hypothetical protein